MLWTTGARLPALRSGLRIERKKFSVALHSRGADAAEQNVNRVAAAVTAWADEHISTSISRRSPTPRRTAGRSSSKVMSELLPTIGWRVRSVHDLCFALTRDLLDHLPPVAAALVELTGRRSLVDPRLRGIENGVRRGLHAADSAHSQPRGNTPLSSALVTNLSEMPE